VSRVLHSSHCVGQLVCECVVLSHFIWKLREKGAWSVRRLDINFQIHFLQVLTNFCKKKKKNDCWMGKQKEFWLYEYDTKSVNWFHHIGPYYKIILCRFWLKFYPIKWPVKLSFQNPKNQRRFSFELLLSPGWHVQVHNPWGSTAIHRFLAN